MPDIDYYTNHPQPRSAGHGLAVVSVTIGGLSALFGILLCVGFLLGIVAILFGLIALIISISRPNPRARNLAILGILLGAVGMLELIILIHTVGSQKALFWWFHT